MEKRYRNIIIIIIINRKINLYFKWFSFFSIVKKYMKTIRQNVTDVHYFQNVQQQFGTIFCSALHDT